MFKFLFKRKLIKYIDNLIYYYNGRSKTELSPSSIIIEGNQIIYPKNCKTIAEAIDNIKYSLDRFTYYIEALQMVREYITGEKLNLDK